MCTVSQTALIFALKDEYAQRHFLSEEHYSILASADFFFVSDICVSESIVVRILGVFLLPFLSPVFHIQSSSPYNLRDSNLT